MRYITYVRKYDEFRAVDTPQAKKKALKAELNRATRNAVNKWLETNQLLGNTPTVKEYLTAWHNIEYVFTLSPKTKVEVTLFNCDQSFTRGYTQTYEAKYSITKKELFN